MPKCPIYEAWLNVCDSIGSPHTWGPMASSYRSAFWGPLNYKNRLLIASICYLNGSDMYQAIQFLRLRKQDECHIRKLQELFTYWNDPVEGQQRRSAYWGWNGYMNCFTDLNNIPRPGQEKYVLM